MPWKDNLGTQEISGYGFDFQTAVKIHMYEVNTFVNQGAVTGRNCVFLYPRDKLT